MIRGFVGIDPGPLTGCMCVIWSDTEKFAAGQDHLSYTVHNFKDMSEKAQVKMIFDIVKHADAPPVFGIEHVNMFGKQRGQNSFGANYYGLRYALIAATLEKGEWHEISTVNWQKDYLHRESFDKQKALTSARKKEIELEAANKFPCNEESNEYLDLRKGWIDMRLKEESKKNSKANKVLKADKNDYLLGKAELLFPNLVVEKEQAHGLLIAHYVLTHYNQLD